MTGKQVIIREVWASNLHLELSLIRAAVPGCAFVSFDTEFPGTLFTPNMGKPYGKLSPSTNYRFMKANVDVLNIIQLGLALSDSNGNLPHFGTQHVYVWQFNFCDFDIERSPHNVESIRLLEKQGIDFMKNKKEGIPSWVFRIFILKSGLMFNPRLTWVTFHSTYDFGFMIKLLTGGPLPSNVRLFRYLVAEFFGPNIYDMKHIMKFCNGLYGGLESVAKALNVDREAGKNHQAGSDGLLTLQTFGKLKEVYFNDNFRLKKFQGILYGFEVIPTI